MIEKERCVIGRTKARQQPVAKKVRCLKETLHTIFQRILHLLSQGVEELKNSPLLYTPGVKRKEIIRKKEQMLRKMRNLLLVFQGQKISGKKN